LRNAFEGNPDQYELVEERKIKTSKVDEPEYQFRLKKVGYKPKPQDSTQEILRRPLDPIREEWISNDMALVPVTYDNQKKQRNELLK
jgi:hypothetical protein